MQTIEKPLNQEHADAVDLKLLHKLKSSVQFFSFLDNNKGTTIKKGSKLIF